MDPDFLEYLYVTNLYGDFVLTNDKNDLETISIKINILSLK